MSSLIPKVNKSRSPVTRKVVAKKGKKAASKKPERPGKITATPKSKKQILAKSHRASSKSASAKATRAGKKVVGKKALSKPASKARKPSKSLQHKARTTSKSVRTKKSAVKHATVSSVAASRAIPKPLPAPPKKPPTPNALAAVRAFEQALKVFHRHDFEAAKTHLEGILEKFPDQAEVTAGARTYLAVCDQRLSRAPSVPRDAESLYDRGVFQFNKGNTREAIELYDKALRSDSRADHVWYSLAAAYARLGDSSKALDALRRAIAIRYVHRSHARRDLDFANLRSNPEFQHLTGFGYDLIDE